MHFCTIKKQETRVNFLASFQVFTGPYHPLQHPAIAWYGDIIEGKLTALVTIESDWLVPGELIFLINIINFDTDMMTPPLPTQALVPCPSVSYTPRKIISTPTDSYNTTNLINILL